MNPLTGKANKSFIREFGFPTFVVLALFGAIGVMWNSDRNDHNNYMQEQYKIQQQQRSDFTKALDGDNQELRRITGATHDVAKGMDSNNTKLDETNRLLGILIETHRAPAPRERHTEGSSPAPKKALATVREPAFPADGGVSVLTRAGLAEAHP